MPSEEGREGVLFNVETITIRAGAVGALDPCNVCCRSFVGGWIFQHGDKSFYGMAIHGNSCTKIGIDSDGPQVTPETRTFDPDPIRERQCVEFFKKYLPKVCVRKFCSALIFCLVVPRSRKLKASTNNQQLLVPCVTINFPLLSLSQTQFRLARYERVWDASVLIHWPDPDSETSQRWSRLHRLWVRFITPRPASTL